MNKREITIFYDNTTYTLRWLSALDWAKDELRKNKIFIHYAEPLHGLLSLNVVKENKIITQLKSKKYDVIVFAYHHISDFFHYDYINLLKIAKKQSNTVIWLDTSDSCGTCKFDVLPYVDKYLKKQLYVDRSIYQREVWGGRLFCEFYHNLTGIEDTFVSSDKQGVLPLNEMHKLGLSWNVGLGNLFDQKLNLFLHLKRRKKFFKKYYHPLKNGFDIHYRGSKKSPIAGYQRNMTSNILCEIENNLSIPDVSNQVSQKQYRKEIITSKCIVSPFGWGEICTRDFEAFLCGAILIKPNMSHLETFPNCFVENNTYVSTQWDFSDFKSKIFNSIDQYNDVKSIGLNGNVFYKNCFSKDGKKCFVKHILSEFEL